MSRPSHEILDYRTRPNKGIERKMIIEALNHFHAFQSLASYKYIGFGGLQFADFDAMHRAFGMRDMVSIEAKARHRERFHFNNPLECIRLEFKRASRVLTDEITPTKRTIVWLDYDGRLTQETLSDTRKFLANARSGSVLLVTANAESRFRDLDDDEGRRRLRNEFGDLVAEDLSAGDLAEWGQAEWYFDRLSDTFKSGLRDRNIGKAADEKLEFVQFLNFVYKDGARMMTVGGALLTPPDLKVIEATGIFDLAFVRRGKQHYELNMPHLTLREIHSLNSTSPPEAAKPLEWLEPEERQRYRDIYRYYPKYFDIGDA